MIWMGFTVMVLPLVITDANLDIGPSFALFLSNKMLKEPKCGHHNMRDFGIILGDLLFVCLTGVVPNFDLGLTACGLPSALGCLFLAFAQALACGETVFYGICGLVLLLGFWLSL